MIIKKAFNVFLASWLQNPLNFLASIIIANELGVVGKGYSVIFVSLINTTGILFSFGLPSAIIYFAQKKNFSLEKIFNFFFLFSILILLTCLLFFNLFDLIFLFQFKLNFLERTIFCFCIFFFIYNNIFSTLILALGKSKNYLFLIILKSLFFLFLIILFLKILKYGLLGYFIAYLIAEFFFFILITFSLKFNIGIKILNFSILRKKEIFKIFTYGIQNFPNSLIAQYQNSFINYFILFLINIEAVGFFSIAMAFFKLMNSVPRAVVTLLLGETAKLDKSKGIIVLLQTTRFLNTIMLIGSVIGFFLVGYLIKFFYVDAFVSSIVPAQIMIFCALLSGNISTLQSYFFANNDPFKATKINFSDMILSILFIFLLASKYDVIGVALSFFLSRMITSLYILNYFFKKKLFNNYRQLIFINRNDLEIFFKKK